MTRLEPRFITAFDLPDAWFQCLKEVLEHGYEYTIDRGSFKGHKRKELDFITIQVTNPSTRPLIPDIPEGLDIPTPTSMDYINKYLEKLITSLKEPSEVYTYGERLEKQIEKIIQMYKKDGFGTNQACMEVGMPTDIDLEDPPCLRVVDTRIQYGKLHFIVYFRSWDLWAGFPSNLAALQLVKEYIGKEVGVDDGEIIACSKGLHLYWYQWELAKKRVIGVNKKL